LREKARMRVNLKDFSLFFILLTPDPLQQERER